MKCAGKIQIISHAEPALRGQPLPSRWRNSRPSALTGSFMGGPRRSAAIMGVDLTAVPGMSTRHR